MSHDDEEWLAENPIPLPPPAGTGSAGVWFEKTFPVGTPVVFRGTGNIQLGNWPIPDGVKGEVVETLPYELRVRLFPPVAGDPRFRGLEDLLARGYKRPLRKVEDVDVFVSIDGAVAGFVEPLIDTWGAVQAPVPRHHLPRSQRSWLKPNAPIVRFPKLKKAVEGFGEHAWKTHTSAQYGVEVDGTLVALIRNDSRDMVYMDVASWRVYDLDGITPASLVYPTLRKAKDHVIAMVAEYGADFVAGRAAAGAAHTAAVKRRLKLNREPWLRPNRKARPLRGASMDTGFGDTVEEVDDVSGKSGRDLDAAMDRYETFHAKAPIRVAELEHDLPKSWVPIGDALAVMYRTDKWKKDGSDVDYKHLHDKGDDKPYELGKGVRFYEPASEASKSRVQGRRSSRPNRKSEGLPVARPEALTLLGYCLGVFVHRYDDEEEVVHEVNPRGCYLFSSPSGDMLAMYSPDKGFLAVMAGGNLRVLKDGIDG